MNSIFSTNLSLAQNPSKKKKKKKKKMAAKSTCVLTTSQPLEFKVIRQPPELIPPVAPTPYEFKELSNFDDQEGFRFHLPLVLFFPNGAGSRSSERDPVRVIKEAIGKVLVPYYPLAGRLREKERKKLVVECNGEGILFIEANAPDMALVDFGEAGLMTPVPCFDQLLYDVPGSSQILHSPLLLFQVTRLKCGGFILALRINHTLIDGPGLVQFMNAIAELARGEHSLSVWPVWERYIFCARDPPRVTCMLHAYDNVVDSNPTITPFDDMVSRSFFIGPSEISALRRLLPPHLRSSTTFEILSACIWRCRTIAIQPDPTEKVRFMFTLNARFKFKNLVPTGYYGNAFVLPMAISTAYKLSQNPLGYALELIKNIKTDVTEEYIRSVADLMEIKGRPHFTTARNFIISDISRDGGNFDNLDYGWGTPVYGGVTLDGVVKEMSALLSFFVSFKNYKGEKGVVFMLCLPSLAMERFIKELHKMLNDFSKHPIENVRSFRLNSSI